jgi:hypothetical protein
MWSGICVGLKTLRRETNGLKKVRSERSDPLETSSFSIMKKAVSLLVCGQNLGDLWLNVKFGECICRSVYTCFAFCLFVCALIFVTIHH